MNASPHLPLITALFVLAPERDADGDEAHEEDLDGHALSPSIGCANASDGRKCAGAVARCEEFFSVCARKFLNAGGTHSDLAGRRRGATLPEITRTV
jgi:hypothetical protein